MIKYFQESSFKSEQKSDPVPSETDSVEASETNVESAEAAVETNEQSSETQVHQRNVSQMHSNPITNTNTNTNVNLNSSSSSSRFTTYLIAVLCLAIGFLLFRRLFLV